MDQRHEADHDRSNGSDQPGCDNELHLRVCARRLATGHLQFTWRVEHVDNIDQEGESLDGAFGPFDLPHECAQEVATLVRSWMKDVARTFRQRYATPSVDDYGVQLTLRDFMAD